MKDCVESYTSLLETLHNICIYSNIFYVIAGLLCFINFKKYYKFVGVGILCIALVSVIHHSNENVGLKAPVWGTLDVTLANTGCVICIVVLVYLLLKKKTHVKLAAATIILGLISIVFFIFSEIESKRISEKSVKSGVNDPTKSWGGNIFTKTEDASVIDYTVQSQQAMYLVYHTIWHILSGLAVMLWVVTVISNPKKTRKK